MKNKNFKLGMIAVCMLSASVLSAQTTSGDITQQSVVTYGTDSAGAIKVVDNKGTIKYLQTANGLTTLTNTTSNVTTTTWQLGGTLTSDTDIATGANEFKITLDSGGTFVLDGAIQETGIHSDASTIGTSGWTLLSRDEATGQIKKLLPSDLVNGIRKVETLGQDETADLDITVSGLPVLTALTTAGKLSVYRNGVKLLFGTDFVVTAGVVTITYDATNLPLFTGDVIEIQYIR